MKRVIGEKVLIIIIFIIALFLRVWGLNYDLPYIYHPDEPYYINISQTIFKSGDLNPHFFNYPSLFFYINALAYIPYYLIGKFMGVFRTPNDILPPISLAMGVTRAQMPTTVLLGRAVTILFGVGTVYLVYLAGNQITNRAMVGILSALMLAVSPTNVWHSRLITPDTFVTFFAIATFLASVRIYQQGETFQYVVAGVLAGLTISSKYNGAIIVFTIILAHVFRYRGGALKQAKLYLALLLCGMSFIATTPYSILDWTKFLSDLRFEASHYSTGHAGMEGNTLKWYIEYMWKTAGIIYILAVLEILRGLRSRTKETILLSVFPVIYFAFISSFVVRNDRTFLPMTPFLFILSASFLVNLIDRLIRLRSSRLRKISIIVVVCFSIIGLALMISNTIKDNLRLISLDSRETARIWVNSNLPMGSKIAIESYSPFIDTTKFSVYGFVRMIDHEPEWYIEQGFDYLIFSQGMYGRFYKEPERYKQEISLYDKMFDSFELVKMFSDGGYEIRVYKVR